MRTYKLERCGRVCGLHFTPDGRRLLVVGGGSKYRVTAAVWLDLASGKAGARITRRAMCHAVDPAVTRFVVGGTDCTPEGGRCVEWKSLDSTGGWQTFPRGALRFRGTGALAFDPSGTRLAIGYNPNGFDGVMDVVHPDTGKILFAPRHGGLNDYAYQTIVFNADGTRVVGAVDYVAVDVFGLKSRAGRSLPSFFPPGYKPRAVLFLPDNRLVVAGGKTVYVIAKAEEPQFTLVGHTKTVNATAVAPDGRLWSASDDGTVRTWEVPAAGPEGLADTVKAGPVFEWNIGPLTALAFAPDRLTCAAAGRGGKIVVWDVDA